MCRYFAYLNYTLEFLEMIIRRFYFGFMYSVFHAFNLELQNENDCKIIEFDIEQFPFRIQKFPLPTPPNTVFHAISLPFNASCSSNEIYF